MNNTLIAFFVFSCFEYSHTFKDRTTHVGIWWFHPHESALEIGDS